jgi:aspartate aminotransferase
MLILILLPKKGGVSFCTRNHFGRSLPGEDQQYIRLAYSGIDREDIIKGLTKFKEWIER